MTRLGWLCGLVMVVAASGCSVCCTPFDAAYPAYGGKWERTNRFHGRVGSAFDPAGPMPGEVIEGELVEGEIIEGEPAEMMAEPTPAMPMGEEAPPPAEPETFE